MDVKPRFHHHEQHERARPYPIYVNVEFVNSRGEITILHKSSRNMTCTLCALLSII